MVSKCLNAEQRRLLVSENTLKNQAKRMASGRTVNIVAINAAVAGAVTAGLAAAAKLHDDAPLAFAQSLTQANSTLEGRDLLVALADIMSAGHVAIQKLAADGGFMFTEVSGGAPKRVIADTVRLTLNI